MRARGVFHCAVKIVEGHMDIAVPVATYTLTYGIGEDGQPIIEEDWESYGDEEVPMLTKTGLLAMAQQTLMMDILGVDDE